jgi:hypothetical protein
VSEDPTREDPTRGHGFDELARAVAEGSLSRRRALKLFAGTAIAALIPSRALAEDCVRICHIPFDDDDGVCRRRRAETRCVSPERAQFHLANHPCDCLGSCASTNRCRTTTTTTTTSAPATTTTTTTTSAPATTTTTTTAAPICSPTGFNGSTTCGSCGSTGTCFCVKTAEGEIRCVENFGFVTNKSGSGTGCTLSTDCNAGDTCFVDCQGVKGCAHPATCTH